jgi:hypothetical protein
MTLGNKFTMMLLRLQNKWTLGIFTFLMVGHLTEHLCQAIQVYGMHMFRHCTPAVHPTQCALGLLGYFFPWLVKSEWLHFGFAVITLGGCLLLWKMFVQGNTAPDRCYCMPPSAPWWKAATYVSVWHLVEHAVLFIQAQTHHNWWGKSEPTSFIQLVGVPRVELHLFYVSVTTALMIVAMIKLWKYTRLPVRSITNAVFTMPSEPGEHGSLHISRSLDGGKTFHAFDSEGNRIEKS